MDNDRGKNGNGYEICKQVGKANGPGVGNPRGPGLGHLVALGGEYYRPVTSGPHITKCTLTYLFSTMPAAFNSDFLSSGMRVSSPNFFFKSTPFKSFSIPLAPSSISAR